MNFHPSVSHRLVLAGDKIGNLGVWDVDATKQISKSEDEDNEEYSSPSLYLFKVHARTLSSIAFAPSHAEKLYTASYDGSIRCVDFKSGTSDEVCFSEGNHDSDGICEMAFADSNTIYYSTFGGEICRVDVRSPTNQAAERFRAHEKKIGGLSLHPEASHLCATSSLDRTMKIWDFRMVNDIEDGEQQPQFVTEYSSRLSISCTSWNQAGDLVCNGYDDTINIFNLRDSHAWKMKSKQPELTPSSTIRHNCQSGKWVTILKAAWQANPADRVNKFVIGNMKRYMDVYNADGVQLARLGGDYVTTVPSACKFHPTEVCVQLLVFYISLF